MKVRPACYGLFKLGIGLQQVVETVDLCDATCSAFRHNSMRDGPPVFPALDLQHGQCHAQPAILVAAARPHQGVPGRADYTAKKTINRHPTPTNCHRERSQRLQAP